MLSKAPPGRTASCDNFENHLPENRSICSNHWRQDLGGDALPRSNPYRNFLSKIHVINVPFVSVSHSLSLSLSLFLQCQKCEKLFSISKVQDPDSFQYCVFCRLREPIRPFSTNEFHEDSSLSLAWIYSRFEDKYIVWCFLLSSTPAFRARTHELYQVIYCLEKVLHCTIIPHMKRCSSNFNRSFPCELEKDSLEIYLLEWGVLPYRLRRSYFRYQLS